MSTSPSPSPSGSAPADPVHPSPPSPEEIADLKQEALDCLECSGRLRTDLELAIAAMADDGYTDGLQTIIDHGCSKGALAAAHYWFQLTNEKRAKAKAKVSEAICRLMVACRGQQDEQNGSAWRLNRDTHKTVRGALAVAADGDPNVVNFPLM